MGVWGEEEVTGPLQFGHYFRLVVGAFTKQ